VICAVSMRWRIQVSSYPRFRQVGTWRLHQDRKPDSISEASQQEASTSISMYCSQVTRGTFSSNNWLLYRERYPRSAFLRYSLPTREYSNIFSGEKETVKELSPLLGPGPSSSFDEPSRFSPRLNLHPEPLDHAWPLLIRDISVSGNPECCLQALIHRPVWFPAQFMHLLDIVL